MLRCVYMHICVWMDIYALICVHRCVHGCVHMYICKSISFMCLHRYVLARCVVWGYAWMYTYLCLHLCVYTHVHFLLILCHLWGACHCLETHAFDYTQTSPKPLWNNPNHLGSHHTQAWGCQMWVLADVSAGIQEDRARLSHWKMHASASQHKSTSTAIKKRVVTVNQ